jgi:hypothetical protein
MRTCGWQSCFRGSPAVAHLQVNLSLSEAQCFHALRNKTLLQSFIVSCFQTLYFIENKLSCSLCFLRLLHVLINGISQARGTK